MQAEVARVEDVRIVEAPAAVRRIVTGDALEPAGQRNREVLVESERVTPTTAMDVGRGRC